MDEEQEAEILQWITTELKTRDFEGEPETLAKYIQALLEFDDDDDDDEDDEDDNNNDDDDDDDDDEKIQDSRKDKKQSSLDPRQKLRSKCMDSLEDFLAHETGSFVDALVRKLDHMRYFDSFAPSSSPQEQTKNHSPSPQQRIQDHTQVNNLINDDLDDVNSPQIVQQQPNQQHQHLSYLHQQQQHQTQPQPQQQQHSAKDPRQSQDKQNQSIVEKRNERFSNKKARPEECPEQEHEEYNPEDPGDKRLPVSSRLGKAPQQRKHGNVHSRLGQRNNNTNTTTTNNITTLDPSPKQQRPLSQNNKDLPEEKRKNFSSQDKSQNTLPSALPPPPLGFFEMMAAMNRPGGPPIQPGAPNPQIMFPNNIIPPFMPGIMIPPLQPQGGHLNPPPPPPPHSHPLHPIQAPFFQPQPQSQSQLQLNHIQDSQNHEITLGMVADIGPVDLHHQPPHHNNRSSTGRGGNTSRRGRGGSSRGAATSALPSTTSHPRGPHIAAAASGLQERRILQLRNVPQDKLNLSDLNDYFKKFGTITNITLWPTSAPEKAFIEFSHHSEAKAAMNSVDAIFGNRHIRVFWARDQDYEGGSTANANANHQSHTDPTIDHNHTTAAVLAPPPPPPEETPEEINNRKRKEILAAREEQKKLKLEAEHEKQREKTEKLARKEELLKQLDSNPDLTADEKRTMLTELKDITAFLTEQQQTENQLQNASKPDQKQPSASITPGSTPVNPVYNARVSSYYRGGGYPARGNPYFRGRGRGAASYNPAYSYGNPYTQQYPAPTPKMSLDLRPKVLKIVGEATIQQQLNQENLKHKFEEVERVEQNSETGEWLIHFTSRKAAEVAQSIQPDPIPNCKLEFVEKSKPSKPISEQPLLQDSAQNSSQHSEAAVTHPNPV